MRSGLLLTGALLLAACAGGSEAGRESSVDVTSVRLSDPLVVPFDSELVPFGSLAVPPTERRLRWIEALDDRICVTTVDGSDPDRVCSDWDSGHDRASFAWSPDGATLYFTPNFRQNFQEPDIWSFEPTTARLTNLTDDGEDEVRADRALTDISPFVADDGTLFFFTVGKTLSDIELTTLDDEGEPDPLPGVRLLGQLPDGPIHPIGGDRFVYRSFRAASEEQPLILLDLSAGSETEIRLPQMNDPVVLASAPDTVVVADWRAAAARDEVVIEVVDIPSGASGEITRLQLDWDLPESFTVPSFGFSPDGSSLVGIYRGTDDRWQMMAAKRGQNGVLGEPIQIGEPGFLGLELDGDPQQPVASGDFPRILWTDDHRLMVPTADGALVFDLRQSGSS